MKRVLLALYLMSAQMLVSAEQSSQYLKCEFCSPIPGLIKNETPRFLFDEIINLKQDFLNYDDSGLDTYQYRTSLATKSLTLLKSQHQINHTHLMYVNYLRAFPHSVPLGNEDDRTKFIAEFEEVFNFFPDSFIVDVRLMPTPFIVTPFIIVVNKVQSLSYQYQLSIDHEMELYRRTFRLMKTLLTARELLIEDFDLFHLEADTEKNRQYVADLLEIETVEHSHKMKQLEKRKLKVFLQELDSQQSLTPKLKKRLYRFYSEQIATTQAEIDDLWQQVQKNSEAFKKVIEGDDELVEIFLALEFFIETFDGSNKYSKIQPALEELKSIREKARQGTFETSRAQSVINGIYLTYPILTPVRSQIKSFYNGVEDEVPVTDLEALSAFIIQPLRDNGALSATESDQAKTNTGVYEPTQNIYYYLKAHNQLDFSNLINPPFQICRKLYSQFEQNHDRWKVSDFTYWLSRLASPPEIEIFDKMIAEKDDADPAKRAKFKSRLFLFLNRCSDQLERVHYHSLIAANMVYDIDFTSDNNKWGYDIPKHAPVFDNFTPLKVYGHLYEACRKTGIKGVLLTPLEGQLNYKLFALAGTEFDFGTSEENLFRRYISAPLDDVITDIHFGVPQLQTQCAQDLMNDAVKYAQAGEDIIFTGHSLGGALSQAFGYLTEERLSNSASDRGQVHVVAWNGFGAKETISLYKNSPLDPNVVERILGVTYFMRNDWVSKIGTHFLETRRLQDKVDSKFLNGISEHMLGVMEQSIKDDFFRRLDYTYPAEPTPIALIDKVGDFWFDMKRWFAEKTND